MKKLTLITITLFVLISCGSLVTTTLEEVPETVVIDNKVNLGLLEYDYYAYPTESNEFFLHGIIIKTWFPRFEAGDSCRIDFKRKNKYVVKKISNGGINRIWDNYSIASDRGGYINKRGD